MGDPAQDFSLKPCPLSRRLAIIFYDLVLLSAILFMATALLMPFTQGNAIHSGNIFYLIYLTAWSHIFFTWQWTHGGQTLGMRAWRVKLFELNLTPVGWRAANRRFFLAIISWLFAGVGFIWAAFDINQLSFHDHYSNSRLYEV